MVRVTRNVSCISASNLAWNAAERVPDGVAAAVFLRRAFDLVTVALKSVCDPGQPQSDSTAGYHLTEN
jgi:hypothetical protein